MKKLLLALMLVSTLIITNCANSETANPENLRYGVKPNSDNASKNSYYAFFASVLIFGFLIVYAVNKANKK